MKNIHWSFWLIVIVMLVWNVMGVINYFMQMNPDVIASFPETHRVIIENRPNWATGGFAIAVFGGVLGCLLLLLKKFLSFYVFVASLIGVIVAHIHTFRVANPMSNFSSFEVVLMILMPLIVALFLIWYSKYAESKGWIS